MRASLLVSFVVVVLACSSQVEVGANLPSAVGGSASGAGQGAGGSVAVSGNGGRSGDAGNADGGAAPCVETRCGGELYACGNCRDDDGDGLVDALDPECLGPCDDTEDSFYRSLPGGGCRQDCYFDGDRGAGNDGCLWSHACDPKSVAPDYPPSGNRACAYDPAITLDDAGMTCAAAFDEQPAACRDACLPLTPNGCDCFGCCEWPPSSGNFFYLGSRSAQGVLCDAAHVNDPSVCRPCTPVPSCMNPCEPCEVCVGRPRPDPSCEPGGSRCGADVQACDPSSGCGPTYYCITGCCVEAPR